MTHRDYPVWLEDSYAVDSEGVRSYARATRSPHVPYAMSRVVPADSPVPSLIVAQPVFRTAVSMMSEEIEDFTVSRLLHVAQTVRQVAPLRIGDVCSIGARITDRLTKAGIDLFEVDCVVTVGDDVRIETSSTVAYAADAEIPVEVAAEGVVMHGSVL
ncbi:MaoC family dehydratase N-terminal domain-containing protein [Tsukamurella sp. 1534]|uniref:FAS1-like dehydratase domain-containing protein n=1 Tax=Tsukamurella sp. 1534 TaxID=1151061 RepID=UPI0002D357FF|nr:MaoC family dehydratase N-terminal domain-containing protein [Tsukamurella sp. 1534]